VSGIEDGALSDGVKGGFALVDWAGATEGETRAGSRAVWHEDKPIVHATAHAMRSLSKFMIAALRG
jgi:hypothetical protein